MIRKSITIKVLILIFLISVNLLILFISIKSNEVKFLGYKCNYENGELIEKESKKKIFEGQVDINYNPIQGTIYNINSGYNDKVFTGHFSEGKINGEGTILYFDGFKKVVGGLNNVKLLKLNYDNIVYKGNFVNNIPDGNGRVILDKLTILDNVEYNVNIKNNDIYLTDNFMDILKKKFVEKSKVLFDSNDTLDVMDKKFALERNPNIMSYIQVPIKSSEYVNDMRAAYLGAELAGSDVCIVDKYNRKFNLYNNYEIKVDDLRGEGVFIVSKDSRIKLYLR